MRLLLVFAIASDDSLSLPSSCRRGTSGAALYHNKIASELGNGFLDDVQRSIDRLCLHPNTGTILSGELRSSRLSRFPFSLIYYIEPDSIVVVAVAHHSRRPGYWRERGR
ncbi:MAG: type II toxin-antitoxin system RelE/ParE family toxin [Acidobacteriota bacterium]